MKQFKNFKLPLLVDMLSDFTLHYSEMLTSPATKKEDIESWKHSIEVIQKEINYRNRKITNL